MYFRPLLPHVRRPTPKPPAPPPPLAAAAPYSSPSPPLPLPLPSTKHSPKSSLGRDPPPTTAHRSARPLHHRTARRRRQADEPRAGAWQRPALPANNHWLSPAGRLPTSHGWLASVPLGRCCGCGGCGGCGGCKCCGCRRHVPSADSCACASCWLRLHSASSSHYLHRRSVAGVAIAAVLVLGVVGASPMRVGQHFVCLAYSLEHQCGPGRHMGKVWWRGGVSVSQ
jgi:hypothetical protein